jgi:signal recognition particle subunit SRP54
VALLEADVNLNVVKELIEHIREKALGQQVLTSLSPTEQVVKIVRDELIAILGKDTARFKFASRPPTVILMAGLQGSGKTTTAGKLAAWLQKGGHRPMLVSVDVYRPAAREQLRVVAKAIKANIYEGELRRAKRRGRRWCGWRKEARREAVNYRVRHADRRYGGAAARGRELMDEMAKLKKLLNSAGDSVCRGRDDRAGCGEVGGGVPQAAGADGRGADEDGWRCAGRRGAVDSARDRAADQVYRHGGEAGCV